MRVEVLSGPHAPETVRLLTRLDPTGLLDVVTAARPGPAALVVGFAPTPDADVVLDPADLPGQVARLWADRLGPFARRFAGLETTSPGPAVLHDHDPALPVAAARLLDRLRVGLRDHDDGTWTYDHIGSTAVPGLRAKPFVDLQVGVGTLPTPAADDVLAAAGFRPAEGARPDSPGVHHDGPGLAPDSTYRKRLYVRPDPGLPAILHVRLLGSPWWAETVRFRDLLRADPAVRRAYQDLKEEAARAHAHDADYDDYTRAKSAFVRRHR
ncbi:GrpB family protein [Saccharothrix sp. SC076]|nr:GrpB family protein [Saccharothrix obliqua]